MIWFKHFTASSSQDPIVSRVKDKFGLEGVGRYYALMEAIIATMDSLQSIPEVTYSPKKWNSILDCKTKVLERFFEHLENISAIKLIQKQNELTIKLLNTKKLLSIQALPSDKRNAKKVLREEETIRDKSKESLTDSSQESESENRSDVLTKVDGVLNECPNELADLVAEYVSDSGPDENFLKSIKRKILDHFSGSNKQKNFGKVILSKVESAYTIAQTEYATTEDKTPTETLQERKLRQVKELEECAKSPLFIEMYGSEEAAHKALNEQEIEDELTKGNCA